ncbi:MAG: protein-L-isoaspartate(D-aspartate) O-methyltransferase [Coraliomargarita sp.]
MIKYPQAEQLTRDIHDSRVRAAFTSVDRSLFVPNSQQYFAWADHPLPIGNGATISQPSLVAQMTEWLELQPENRVLEIGTGSGYQTAILANLVREVYTIEINRQLSSSAAQRLQTLGYNNIHFRCGDGSKGWPDTAPFDRILATVAFNTTPRALIAQLKPNGICIAPVGPPERVQHLFRYRNGDSLTETNLAPVRFLSLR